MGAYFVRCLIVIVVSGMGLLGTVFSSSISVADEVVRPPQYVVMAFDGSKSITMWDSTRSFAQVNNLSFTYFISGVYFLTSQDRHLYVTPMGTTGRSDIGFGDTRSDLQQRISQVHSALSEGHEIASHANGHFNGNRWSKTQWDHELISFFDLIRQSWNRYQDVLMPEWWTTYFSQNHQQGIVGFRAPLLGHNEPMFSTLQSLGYRYDTSRIMGSDYWPQKRFNQNGQGIWDFALAGIRLSRSGKRTVSMDYNIYVAQSEAKRAADHLLQGFEDEVVETYLAYFKSNYFGNRAPVNFGHHFSLWNGGIYWRAMKRVAEEICHLPEVICGTFADLLYFMESQEPHVLVAYAQGRFERLNPNQVQMGPQLWRASTRRVQLSEYELEALRKTAEVCPAEAHREIVNPEDLREHLPLSL